MVIKILGLLRNVDDDNDCREEPMNRGKKKEDMDCTRWSICLRLESKLRLKSFLREVLVSMLSGILIFLECCFSISVNRYVTWTQVLMSNTGTCPSVRYV